MARTSKVEVEIVATDDASPKIDRLETKIDGLESDEARVKISADTTRLEQQLAKAKAKLDTLDGDEATVQARLVGSLEKDLADAKRLFDQLDGKTGTVKFRADTKGAKRDLSELKELAERLPGPLGEAAGLLGGAGGIAAGGTLVAGALIAATKSAADYALTAQTIADLAGSSVEDASRWLAITKQVGIEYNDLADIVGQVGQVLIQQPALAKQLGINLQDGRNGLERILQVLDSVNASVDDANQRTFILGQLFGEQGVRQIQKLATAVGGDLQTALDKVSGGQIVSPADVERARQFQALWAELTADVQAVVLAIGNDLIPALHDAEVVARGINSAIGLIPDQLESGLRKMATQSLPGTFKTFYQKSIGDLLADAPKPQTPIIDNLIAGISDVIDKEIEHGRALQAQIPSREAANRQLEDYIGWLERVGTEADTEATVARHTDEHTAALIRLNDEAEAHDRITPLQREADAARAATTEYQNLFGELDREGQRLRLIRAFESLKERIADGTLSLIDGQIAINDLRTDVAKYAQDILKLPPDVTTSIVSEVDFGSLDKAQNDIMNWADRQHVVVPVKLAPIVSAALASGASADQLERLSKATGSGTPSSSNPVTNVTVVQAPGQPAVVYGANNLHITRNGLEQRPNP